MSVAQSNIRGPYWSERASGLVHVCIIILSAFLAYSNTFHAPFQLDEYEFIIENPVVRDCNYPLSGLRSLGDVHASVMQRQVGYLSFALNHRLHGFQVEGYHILNLTIHLLSATLLYLLVRRTFKAVYRDGQFRGDHAATAALFSALFFALQPVQTEAVTYVYQRMASLAAFFVLLSLYLYSLWRSSVDDQEARSVRWRQAFFYGGSLVSLVLAMKTKENAITFPLILACYELFFFRGNIRKRLLLLTPFLLTMLIVPVTTVVLILQTGKGFHDVTAMGPALSRIEYLLTETRVLMTYFRLLLWPAGQNFIYEYPAYRTITEPAVIGSIAVLVLFSIAGVLLFRRSLHGEGMFRITSFGMLWFLIAISVESGISPLPMVINEYRLYLPSAGIAIALGSLIYLCLKTIGPRTARTVFLAILLLGCIGLGSATYARNSIWNDPVIFWEDVVRKSPNVALARVKYAISLEDAGRLYDAISQYREAVSLSPGYAKARLNMIMCYLDHGYFQEAYSEYATTMQVSRETAQREVDDLVFLMSSGRGREALAAIQRAYAGSELRRQ